MGIPSTFMQGAAGVRNVQTVLGGAIAGGAVAGFAAATSGLVPNDAGGRRTEFIAAGAGVALLASSIVVGARASGIGGLAAAAGAAFAGVAGLTIAGVSAC